MCTLCNQCMEFHAVVDITELLIYIKLIIQFFHFSHKLRRWRFIPIQSCLVARDHLLLPAYSGLKPTQNGLGLYKLSTLFCLLQPSFVCTSIKYMCMCVCEYACTLMFITVSFASCYLPSWISLMEHAIYMHANDNHHITHVFCRHEKKHLNFVFTVSWQTGEEK